MSRSNRITLAAAGILIAIVTLTYSNHFQNTFHFDDSHAVVDNPYIQSLRNIGLFFTDTRTSGSLPPNHVYRPLVSTSLAIDYALAGGLKPVYFQASTFFWFLTQLLLMYALFRKVCDLARPDPRNRWVALWAVALYGLHPALAETVNYIVQRADVYSTLGVVAALTVYVLWPGSRRSGWYLAPFVLAVLCKPPALIFPMILLAYTWLFEERQGWAAVKHCIPALVVAVVCGFLTAAMSPPTPPVSAYAYRITQPLVTLRYFRTFFMPTHLSADTDFSAVNSVFENGAWLGFIFVALLIAVAVWCSRRREWRPAAFGLWWFLLASVPAAVFPLSEVENDHRMYFPFAGLALAVSWPIALWLYSRKHLASSWRAALAGGAILTLAASAWATRTRNEVWRTDESLWFDVTRKSPHNGRGLMNYGLTQMEKGDYRRAEDYFERALVYNPNYVSLEINLGIANGGLNQDVAAEAHFRRALTLAPESYDAYFFFGRWLRQKNRAADAISAVEKSIELNADYMPARYFLMELFAAQRDWRSLRAAADSTLQRFPSETKAADFLAAANSLAQSLAQPSAGSARTADEYVNLSLAYYQARKFDECIKAARAALKLDPNYAAAYNNMAAAYAAMHQWNPAVEAARQALRIKPDFELARNNLAWAESQQALLKK